MFWELVILGISFIILAFDVAWQFYVAGIYAPKKARRLILDDPMFQKLDQTLVTIESELTAVAAANDSSVLKNIQKNLESLNSKENPVTEISDRIKENYENIKERFENLKNSFKGKIGKEVQDFYSNMELDLEGETSDLDPESPLSKIKIREAEQQVEYDMVFNALQVVMPEDVAESWAYRYAVCPPFLKKKLKSTINKWTGGMFEDVPVVENE